MTFPAIILASLSSANLAGVINFLGYYFVRPWFDCSGYNWMNTLGLIAVLVLLAVGLKKLLEKERIKVDENFFWMLVPFVFLGGILRSLEDLAESPLGCVAARTNNPWLVLFITPFIYLLLLILVVSLIFLARKFSSQYQRTVSRVGWGLVGLTGLLAVVNGERWLAFIVILFLAGIGWGVLSLVFRVTGLNRPENNLVAYGQMLDASASSVAVGFLNYGEQHVVTGWLMKATPLKAFAFLPVKMVLAFLVIYIINKEVEGNWKWLLLFLVLMIGLAPGLRDVMRVLMGV